MRDGRHVAASGSSRRSEATGEKARWPSISIYLESDHIALGDVVKLIMYLGVVRGFGQREDATIYMRAAPPLLSASHFRIFQCKLQTVCECRVRRKRTPQIARALWAFRINRCEFLCS